MISKGGSATGRGANGALSAVLFADRRHELTAGCVDIASAAVTDHGHETVVHKHVAHDKGPLFFRAFKGASGIRVEQEDVDHAWQVFYKFHKTFCVFA